MPKVKLRKWDAAAHLRDEADIAAYLEAAIEDGDPALLAAVRSDIARARRRLGTGDDQPR
jgi:probable addiction module antidote protein